MALGEYDLWVKKGVITILGATLSAGSMFEHTTVYAPSSHSLPVIRYLESLDNEVIIQLCESPTRLRGLRILSPLFSRLWNETSTPIPGKDMPDRMTSFQIVCFASYHPELNINCCVAVLVDGWAKKNTTSQSVFASGVE